jgi:hypothetical protein
MHRRAFLAALVFSISAIPMAGKPARAWKTATCRSFSLRIRKKAGHKAVVSASHLDYEHCFGTWGEPSKDAAIEKALQACKREGGMTGCVVVWAE